MITVYSAPSLPTVAWLHERLTDQGIDCLIRNEFLSSAAGELPPIETWPSLSIFDPKDEVLARKMVAELTDDSEFAGKPDWQCTQCGTLNGAIFGSCWQCQRRDLSEPQIEP